MKTNSSAVRARHAQAGLNRRPGRQLAFALACLFTSLSLFTARAQDPAPQQSKSGPVPPPAAGAKPLPPEAGGGTSKTISGVPGYLWRHGCGPTAVGMVVGYYDTHGYSDLISGDASTQTSSVDQAIASQGSGVRGSGTQLHYEDYSLPMDSSSGSPIADSSVSYPTGCHADNCVADYMQTSWSSVGNKYGWSWSSRVAPAFTSYVNLRNSSYSPQCTQYSMGETLWTTLVTEVDNNRPMVFLVDSDGDGSTDHFVTIVGYSDSPSRQYACLDTWVPASQVRWCDFRSMSSSYSWGVWGGWTFRLAAIAAEIGRSPTSLAPTCTQGANAPAQSFVVWNKRAYSATLNYTISDNVSWLSCSPSSGTHDWQELDDTITVNYTTAGLSAGTYYATITVSDSAAANNPQTISVTLTVSGASAPEVEVQGNSVVISDGDTTPSTTDFTDLGSTCVGWPVSRTYTVRNIGNATLTTSGLAVPAGYTITEGLSGSIAAGGSDTFTIRLDATAAGIQAGDISFSNNDSDENPFNFRISGVVYAPEVEVRGNSAVIADGDTSPSTADSTDFGSTCVGTTVSRVYTVNNLGPCALTTSGLSVPAGFTVTEGLSASIAGGASDTFTVRLDAAAAGTYAGDISFANADSDENPFTFRITGAVYAPEIEVRGNNVVILDGDETPSTTDSTDFGSTCAGTTVSRVYTVSNSGPCALTISALAVPSGYAVTESLSGSIAAGASDTFTVRLNATTAGTFAGDISLANNDSDENPFTFRITGTVYASDIEVRGNNVVILDDDTTPSSADYSDFGLTCVGTAVSRVYTVSNLGPCVLTISGVTVPTGFTLTEGLTGSLPTGASDTFTVRLNATTAGTYSGDINIVCNDGDENPFNFRILGEVGAPEVEVRGNTVVILDGDTTPSTADFTDFGSTCAGTSVSRVFTICNVGACPLIASSLFVPTGFTIVEGLSINIPPAGCDTVTVRFDATAAGTYAGDVLFVNSDSDENPFNFRITATAIAPTAEVEVRGNNVIIADGDATPSSTDYTDFGSTCAGVAVSRVFSICNLGPCTLTPSSLFVPTGFTITEGLSNSIPAGACDTITIRFDATAAGTYAGDISFVSNDSDENPFNFRVTATAVTSTAEIEVRGNNVIITDGDATPSAADFTDFGTACLGAPVSRIFTVSNLGPCVLTTSALAAPAGFVITEGLSTSIPANGRDTFTVQLTAATAGTYAGDVSLVSNDANENPFNFRITGTVTGPVLSVTPPSNHFGSLLVGTCVDRSFYVTNTGCGTLAGTATTTVPFSIYSGGSYSLTPGQGQAVVVRFCPTMAGTDSNVVTFTMSGGASALRTVVGVSTTAPPVLTVTPASQNFGTNAIGANVDRYFYVTNTGGGTLVGTSTVAAPFGVASNAAYTLTAGQGQAVVIRYSPTAAGNHSNVVNFSIAGAASVLRPVTGVCTTAPPVLVVTPASQDFGTVVAGGSADRSFYVTNTGGGILVGTSSVAAPFSVVANAAYNLASGQGQEVVIRYSPTAAASHGGTVTFTMVGGTSVLRPVSGVCTGAPPPMTVVPASHHFGTIGEGTNVDRTFYVTNTGTGPLAGLASAVAPFSVVSGANYNMAVGASQAVVVRYSPTTAGSHSNFVTFTMVGGTNVIRPVTGVATSAPPVLLVGPASHNFGTITLGSVADRTFYVTNGGGGTLVGSAGVATPFGVASNSTYSLTAGRWQSVVIRYTPTSVGSHSNLVTFTQPSGISQWRPVSGIATDAPPVLTVTPDSQDFGSVVVGTNADRSFNVTNTGGGTLVGSVSVPPPFSVISNSTYSLTAGRGQIVMVRYSPTNAATHSDVVTFTQPSGINVLRPVSGVATDAPPVLTVTPASQDFGTIASGSTADRFFNVTNTGGGTLVGGATVPPPFSVIVNSNYSLTAGSGQSVMVRYSPTNAASHSNVVTFSITGGAGIVRPVLGVATGSPPVLLVSPASHHFGTIPVGTTADRTFYVTNGGEGTLVGSVSVVAPFAVVSNSTYSLTAGRWQSVVIRYSPTSAASHSNLVTFTKSGGTGVWRPVTGSATASVSLGDAVDAPHLPWSTNGAALWTGEATTTHDGVDAAQSGRIGANQCTELATSVNGPGTLSFWWKVSSEADWDYLSVSVDGVEKARLSGEQDWQKGLDLVLTSAGDHEVTWRYCKDFSADVGLDAGWVDQVSWVTAVPVITQVQRRPDGLVDLRIESRPGNGCQIITSRDLHAWKPIEIVTNLTGVLFYTDRTATNEMTRFYRVLELAP